MTCSTADLGNADLGNALLRQWGNIEKAPAGAGTAAAVRKKLLRGDSCGGVGLLGKRRGNGPLWVDWVMKGRGGGIG